MPSPATLIGRAVECDRLLAAIDAEHVVLVTGEAGIGKTTLVRTAAEAAGRRLVAGAGFQTLQAMPYVALRVALGSLVEGSPESVAARVEAAVDDGILFLDDLQWMDHETRAVVPLLAGRVTLVLAARTAGAATGTGLAALDLHEIRLGPIDPAAARAIVAAQRPDLDPARAGEVIARAAGNPLLLEELARDGRESPSIARALTAHVASASDTARAVLVRLAIADRPLRLAIHPVIERELTDLGLVERSGDRLAIRHALIADAVLLSVDDDERRRGHASLAEAAEDEADAAFHLLRAGERDNALRRATRALDGATDLRRRSVLRRIAAEAADGMAALELRIAAATDLLALQDGQGALEILEGQLALPDDVDPFVPGPVAELCAEFETHLAAALTRVGRDADGDAAIERARAYPYARHGLVAVRIAVEASTSLANRGDVRAGIATLEAVADAASHADPEEHEAFAIHLAVLRFLAGRPAPAGLVEALDRAAARGDARTDVRASNVHSIILGQDGPAAALAYADRIVASLRAAGLPWTRLASERVQTLVFLGRSAEAVIAADELIEEPVPFVHREWTRVQRAEALCTLGRLEDARETLRLAAGNLRADWTDRGEWLTTSAHVALWEGRPRESITMAEEVLAMPVMWPGNLALVGLTRAWAQVELGMAPGRLVDGMGYWIAGTANGEWAAIEAFARDDPAAPGLMDRAADAWGPYVAFREAHCRWAAAEAARRHGLPDAVDRLEAALRLAESRDYAALAVRVRRSLRLAGVDVRSRPTTPVPGLLTAREREILAFVAAGQSNIEIARRMGLGRPTVARILSNAMAKLGAETRAQAVTMAETLA